MHRIPNSLTILRMVLTPAWWVVLVRALYDPTTAHTHVALIMLAFLAFTDKADGWLAKCNNGRWKSTWGAKWDPIADKALFWSSMVIICVWMSLQIDKAPTLPIKVLALFCAAATAYLTGQHIQLDIQSTKLRSVDGQGAEKLGQMKFAVDLLTLALALVGAWYIGNDAGSIGYIYILIMMSIGFARFLATINVNNRRAALRSAT